MLALYTTLIYIHISISIILIAIILVQRTTGNGLFTSSQTNVFMSGTDVAQFVTKLTTILIAIFFINTLLLAKISYSINKHEGIVSTQEMVNVETAIVPNE